MRVRNLLLPAIALLARPSTQLPANIDKVEWNDRRWEIASSTLDQGHYQSRMSLANGYLGINLAALGPFHEADEEVNGDVWNGWPLFNPRQTFATIVGFYDADDREGGTNYPWLSQYGGDSFLSGIPHWSGLVVTANGYYLNASTSHTEIDRFATRLDMKGGLLRWTFDWTPGDNNTVINVEYEMFVHKLHVNQAAVQIRLKSDRDASITVYDVLDGKSAIRADHVESVYQNTNKGLSSTIWTAVSPKNLTDIQAYVVSTLRCDQANVLQTRSTVDMVAVFNNTHEASIGQSINIELVGGKRVEVTKYIGAASSDAFEDPKNTAIMASLGGAEESFIKMRASHIKEWESIMSDDSVDRYNYPNGSLPSDPSIRELAITSVTNTFVLLQNTVGPNAIVHANDNPRLNIHSIPVCGLGSDCYGGLVFWDAETWMALGLQLSHPQHIENVVNYRVEKHPQAKENIKTAFTSSKNQTGRFTGGAVYPWTSGRYGNCTASGPCFDYEYHVNGDIGIAFRNHSIATGDAKQFKERFLPISNDIAYFYGELVDYNETTGYYEIRNATDPDEYANNIDNPGFTTALIQRHLNETNEFNSMFGLPQNETWNMISAKMRLPVHEEAGIVMEYTQMNGSIVVKQADIVLIDDILNYQNPYSLVDLDYYANKQSLDGPGMTYASFSIVANEISPSGCSSYTYNHYSSQPYARSPWFLYSEQMIDNVLLNGGTHPAFPFLTGMGGANRVGIFGYLGIRMFLDRLDIDPSIPPQIPQIDYRTFYWQGYGINAYSNATHTTLERLPDKILETANPKYKKSIPVSLGTRKKRFNLHAGEMLVIPNRLMGQTHTVAGNILQCKPVLVDSTQSIFPGQFAIGAVDGASSTKWQPENSTRTNYITVDIGNTTSSFTPIAHVYFDWAAVPPAYFEVLVSNSSIPPFAANASEAEGGDLRNVTSGWVEISEPYDPERAQVIQPVKGNQTNVTIPAEDRVWGGRYVHLGIWGNVRNKTGKGLPGGTVAEWSVVLETPAETRQREKVTGYVSSGAESGQEILGMEESESGDEEGNGEEEMENTWLNKIWPRWGA